MARPALALLLALTLAGGVAQAQTKINPGWNLFSPQQDAEIGAQSASEAERQLPVLNDATVDAYVNRIGQKLAANAGGPNFQYHFRVVNASDINAFALPGGYVYINRGILDQADTEGEVAGVVAHEIAHVALRHGTHQASKAYAAQAGLSILGGILGGKVGQNTAQILNTVGGIGLNALFLKFSRDLETQADVRGAQILAASGYTPADMVSFFQKLEKVDTAKKTNWLASHPAPPDRIARIRKESGMLRVADSPTKNTQELASIQSRMSRFGNAPTMADISRGTSTGTASNGPMTSSSTVGQVEAPSRTMRTFNDRSGVYTIAYPSNWRAYENGSFGVTLAPEGGVGNVGGKTEVVYGAMVAHYEPSANAMRNSLRGTSTSASATLNAATNDLLTQIQQGSPHLRVLRGSEQSFTIDGGRAVAASLRGVNPNTRIDERVTVVSRQLGDGHLMYILFVTPERDASAYSGVLQSMVRSVQVEEHQH
jgi:Zn-dependent protease with chaperone function